MVKESPLISIVIRSYNEGWALGETLAALCVQDYPNWELIVIDGGSSDGSKALIEEAKPQHFIQIEAADYNPSRVMNQGMRLARSNLVIFLNADATPIGRNWLRPLVESLQDRRVAAVFGRQFARPNCDAVYAADYDRCFGNEGAPAHLQNFFSMVSSGIRKDIWALRGFNERMQFSEDDEYTRWCRAMGYKVVYVPESGVTHSHNYGPRQAARRQHGEGVALAMVWEGSPRELNFFRTVLLGCVKDARRDLMYCYRNKRMREWPYGLYIRYVQRSARLKGFRSGWKRFRENSQDSSILPPVWLPDSERKLSI
ncbi:MAG: glycosyltransferase [Opitutales bacterium]|nr:glycosyltransferase [Opitutales bacterium]